VANRKPKRNTAVEDGAMPVSLPGFDAIKRYWDAKNNIYSAKIGPGEFYVSNHGEMIATVLGSCISACIRDKTLGVGGMNHFMLPVENKYSPSAWAGTPVNTATRYGNVAMERLINVILASGGDRNNLEIKLFGGAKVLNIDSDVGRMNIDFVSEYIKTEGFKITTHDLGGICARKVNYYPSSGRVRVKKLLKLYDNTLTEREQNYIKELEAAPVKGDIDIFVRKR